MRLIIWWSRGVFSIFGGAKVILGLSLARIVISSDLISTASFILHLLHLLRLRKLIVIDFRRPLTLLSLVLVLGGLVLPS